MKLECWINRTIISWRRFISLRKLGAGVNSVSRKQRGLRSKCTRISGGLSNPIKSHVTTGCADIMILASRMTFPYGLASTKAVSFIFLFLFDVSVPCKHLSNGFISRTLCRNEVGKIRFFFTAWMIILGMTRRYWSWYYNYVFIFNGDVLCLRLLRCFCEIRLCRGWF